MLTISTKPVGYQEPANPGGELSTLPLSGVVISGLTDVGRAAIYVGLGFMALAGAIFVWRAVKD